jgi:hypothetical protein
MCWFDSSPGHHFFSELSDSDALWRDVLKSRGSGSCRTPGTETKRIAFDRRSPGRRPTSDSMLLRDMAAADDRRVGQELQHHAFHPLSILAEAADVAHATAREPSQHVPATNRSTTYPGESYWSGDRVIPRCSSRPPRGSQRLVSCDYGAGSSSAAPAQKRLSEHPSLPFQFWPLFSGPRVDHPPSVLSFRPLFVSMGVWCPIPTTSSRP